ncbi:MAG: ATP-dependent metallopeptidase HflB, partial [Lachnospiraceae bacterium]|nr:ATP-dependent metallopeptidase HflB [Lachnospiraceae bacterium]
QYLDGAASMTCGEATASQVDEEVLAIITSQYDHAMQLLTENRQALDEISEYLYEKETITGKEFMDMFRKITGIEGEPEEKSEEDSMFEED